MELRTGTGQISLADSFRISEDAVFRELDGEAVILDLERGTYFGLNESGTRIWNLIQQHGSLEGVLEVLGQEYDAVPDTLKDDLLQLVRQLHQKGLICVATAQP